MDLNHLIKIQTLYLNVVHLPKQFNASTTSLV